MFCLGKLIAEATTFFFLVLFKKKKTFYSPFFVENGYSGKLKIL